MINDIRSSFCGKAMDFVMGAGKPAPFFILFTAQYTPIVFKTYNQTILDLNRLFFCL